MIPCLPVNEIRDYHSVNLELVRLLDRGATRIRLTGVEGQRLLLQGLEGQWNALVEILGPCGPEFAADLDAPGLLVVAHQSAADGAGRSLKAGTLVVLGQAANALAYRQSGGLIIAASTSGHRAGLEQCGGTLLLLGPAGRLTGERQSGGRLYCLDSTGPSPAHAHRGGRFFVAPDQLPDEDQSILDQAQALLNRLAQLLESDQA